MSQNNFTRFLLPINILLLNCQVARNIIEQITVDAWIYLPDDPYEYFPAFADAMRRYSLPNILSEFGVPSRILLQVQGQIEQNAGAQAEILMFLTL